MVNLERYKKKYSIIFLGKMHTPTELVIMKRNGNKKFAPNLYSGFGGLIHPGEDIKFGAFRELKEEAKVENIELDEFARVFININEIALFYYFGVVKNQDLPLYSDEGEIELVNINDILKKDLIPTCKIVLQEWLNRMWNFYNHRFYSPFTVRIDRQGNQANSLITNIEIEDNLKW